MFGFKPPIAIGTRVQLTDAQDCTITVLATRYESRHPVAARINDPIPEWTVGTAVTVYWAQPLGLVQQPGKILRCSSDFVHWMLHGAPQVTNRRQYPRYAVRQACLFGFPEPEVQGVTLDLSEGGVQWHTPDARWQAQDSVLFRMDLPTGSFLASVRIVRRERIKDYETFRYAGTFHAVGALDREHLRRFLRQLPQEGVF
jgi:hypothetical protein